MNFIIPLAVVALLAFVFFVATRSHVTACVIRSVCVWMARPWLLLSWVCLHIAYTCQRACVTCLHRHEDTGTETPSTTSFPIGAPVRLVYLLVSSITLIAEFANGISNLPLQPYIVDGFNTLAVVAACMMGLISVIMVLLGLAGIVFAGGYGAFLLLHLFCALVGNWLASFAQDRNTAGVSVLSTVPPQEMTLQTPVSPTTVRQDIRNRTNQKDLPR